jgi:hypothetical protein
VHSPQVAQVALAAVRDGEAVAEHERLIALEPWQREIVEHQPGRFLRGLFHSDGSRVQNWARREAVAVLDAHVGPKS